jgi:hypothetical protein
MVRLLTPRFGKLSVVARHARGSRKRFPNCLDIFDRGTALISLERSGAASIKEFIPERSLKAIRSDLDKLTLASLLCESFDLIVQEHEILQHDRGQYDGGSSDDRDSEAGGDPASAESFELFELALRALDEAATVREGLRATFIALASLVHRGGLLDTTQLSPGRRSLETLLHTIETFCERRLLTRSSLQPLFERAQREG